MSVQQGNEQIVRTEFQKQARGFSNKSLSLNSEDLLKWIHRHLPLNEGVKMLDVAAGTGILSRYLAPYVNKVISVDLSPDMIAEGIERNNALNISNIEFNLAHAEQIPSDKEAFDLVISRLAFHHFTNPKKVLEEMIRVSKLSGTICIVDMISPEDNELYHQYNHYERLRDPSHTNALKETEFIKLFENAGLDIQTIETIDVPINVNKWLELTSTADQVAVQIIEDIQLELADKKTTGLFPYIESGEVMFTQKWIKVIGGHETLVQ
ncbi:class I SAM-dependent methyltransferase [Paenibacillus antarcticus]|uniref:Methyltransferase domain-containing protein n=1 Tax=Paenibacillus antarcticus TaxID=253703 RepID=A0A168MQK7_9BACL|nr:methyltransferase domain-containing protein [Paenibacillus antarcticus]OAB44945.1 hypothetical protein PBAT_13385 [Paenibacillus antarcticus]